MTNAHTHCPMHGAPTLQGTLNTLVYDVSPGALHMLNRPCKSSMQAAVEAPLSCMALGRGMMQMSQNDHLFTGSGLCHVAARRADPKRSFLDPRERQGRV